jgi:hypothetical protein
VVKDELYTSYTMKTLREKITLALTALAWLLFHVSTDGGNITSGSDATSIISGASAASIAAGTFIQILTLAPYTIGISYILVISIRHFSGGVWPPWDRILRIFFTVGMFFAFFFSLYQHGERGELRKEETGEKPATVSQFCPGENQKVKLYWA